MRVRVRELWQCGHLTGTLLRVFADEERKSEGERAMRRAQSAADERKKSYKVAAKAAEAKKRKQAEQAEQAKKRKQAEQASSTDKSSKRLNQGAAPALVAPEKAVEVAPEKAVEEAAGEGAERS